MAKRPGRARLEVEANGTVERARSFTGFMPTNGVTYFEGMITICKKVGANFQCRLACQTATTDVLVPTAWIPMTVGTGTGQKTTEQVRYQFKIDLTDAGNGNIDQATMFRLGLLFSDSAGGLSQGDVYVEFTILET